MALGALRSAQHSGKNIPADFSVIGFDDIPLASLNEPRLTTIRVPKRQMGAEAAQRVLALLNNAGVGSGRGADVCRTGRTFVHSWAGIARRSARKFRV